MMNVQFPPSPILHLITVAINNVCPRLPGDYRAAVVVGLLFSLLFSNAAFLLSLRA